MKRPSQSRNDTVAAIATALGGPVAVVRLSGPDAPTIGDVCWSGCKPLSELPPRELHLGIITGAEQSALDHCLAVRFPGPNSYTGEDMLEIHCHGGALTARAVLMRLLDCGARHADPGEFTKRAFLNGKMDLTQAEAVADIIEAHSHMALHLANRQLDGMLGRELDLVYERLTFVLGEIESRLDFTEEDLDWLPAASVSEALEKALARIAGLLENRREGEILRNGVRLVIAGAPNVGKSSLLNAILGRNRAIVTHVPGTTRDTLEELAHVRGIPVRLVDTAGIREAEDQIERSGIERSIASLEQAQIVLWVCDATDPASERQPPVELRDVPVITVCNKVDKIASSPAPESGNSQNIVYTCALTGQGFEELFDAVERAVWTDPHVAEPEVAVSVRHAALLDQAAGHLRAARPQCETENWELVAVGLRGAIDALGQITGRTAGPDILEEIFSRFCIGK